METRLGQSDAGLPPLPGTLPHASPSALSHARANDETMQRTDANDKLTQTSARVSMLQGARLLLLAMWLGAAVFFSFAVAPSAFAVLPARELAGAIVNRLIAVVNVGGFVISLLLLATAFVKRGATDSSSSSGGSSRRAAWALELIALVTLTAATGTGQWVIAARMAALRASMGRPIDAVAVSDPLRVAFNSLHGYSVAAMTVGMLAALVAFVLIARRGRENVRD